MLSFSLVHILCYHLCYHLMLSFFTVSKCYHFPLYIFCVIVYEKNCLWPNFSTSVTCWTIYVRFFGSKKSSSMYFLIIVSLVAFFFTQNGFKVYRFVNPFLAHKDQIQTVLFYLSLLKIYCTLLALKSTYLYSKVCKNYCF